MGTKPGANFLLKKIILLFIVSRLFFLGASQIASRFVTVEKGYLGSQVAQGEPGFIWRLANMDGRHYIWVAKDGYTGSNFAFFPLYPSLIGLVNGISGLTFIYSGILISVLASLGAIYFIVKLIRLENEKASVLEPIFLLLFFPLSFLLSSVYADALFLFFTTTTFYFARKKLWLICGVFAALASLTRLTGLALIPALILEWWLQSNRPRLNLSTIKKYVHQAAIAPILNFLGFALYPLYLQLSYGNWQLFQTSMSAWKQDKFTTVITVIYRYIRIFLTVSPRLYVYWVAVLEFITFLLYFGLSIYVFRKIRASYGLFMMVLLLLVTFTGTFAGTPRYLLHLFPAYIGISVFLRRYPSFRFVYYPITLVLGAILATLFTQGYFIT